MNVVALFLKTFPINLTDNGTKFGDPLSLEFNDEGIGRTRIFYCNPRASYPKGMIEKKITNLSDMSYLKEHHLIICYKKILILC